MDRLTSMFIFVASVDTGSLSAAARQAGLSQAMVSKHIRSMEEELGVRLMNLTTRKLTLTEAGAAYYRRCVQILGDVEDAGAEAMQLQTVPKGLLRLAAPLAFGEMHLAAAIAAFLDRYPDIMLEVEFSDRFADLANEGFDLAVRIGRLPDSSLVARSMGVSRMLTCASPAYLEAHGTPAHPAELSRHRCLCLSTSTSPGEWWYRENGRDLRINVKGPLRANSMALANQAAVQGLGIVFGPAFALRPLIADGSLSPVLDSFEGHSLDIHVVYLGSRRLSTKIRLLIDFLIDRFQGGRAWNDYSVPFAADSAAVAAA